MVAEPNASRTMRSRASSTANLGSAMPMATSLSPILQGTSAPIRTSHDSRVSAPPASAWPVQAATVGMPNP